VRRFLTAAVLLTLPGLASAQRAMSAKHTGMNGGFFYPGQTGPTVPGPGFPFSGAWSGFNRYPSHGIGGFGFGGFGFGGGSYPVPVFVPVPVPVGPPEPPPQPTLVLANEFPAVLTLEFPAVAEVWVNGQQGIGEPAAEWTLTSPVLKAGGEYTFAVKARWKAGGRTFEYERSVTVAGGQRSRSLVVAGTAVKD